jgi:DNA-binding transcriptional MerR regulator
VLASASVALRSKSPEAFRTISEVATDLDVPQHVLRFWEGRFNQIKPVKRAGGRRYYRPEDVDLLRGIRTLLYVDGFTIKGVQKILRDRGLRYVAERGRNEVLAVEPFRRELAELPVVPGRVEQSNVIALERMPDIAPIEDPSAVLADGERVKLELLLAELLQLKARLRPRAS